jgi:hypothetical protein
MLLSIDMVSFLAESALQSGVATRNATHPPAPTLPLSRAGAARALQ